MTRILERLGILSRTARWERHYLRHGLYPDDAPVWFMDSRGQGVLNLGKCRLPRH